MSEENLQDAFRCSLVTAFLNAHTRSCGPPPGPECPVLTEAPDAAAAPLFLGVKQQHLAGGRPMPMLKLLAQPPLRGSLGWGKETKGPPFQPG